MPQLIDERLCGQLWCTHLLLFHSVVCRSSFVGIVSQCLELPRQRINRALALFRAPWTESKRVFGVGEMGAFVSRQEKILFWKDCSSNSFSKLHINVKAGFSVFSPNNGPLFETAISNVKMTASECCNWPLTMDAVFLWSKSCVCSVWSTFF